MDNKKIALQINEAVKTKRSIVLGCNCSVNYSGRAESFLDFGDRVIIIKEDSTLLVHQPTGNNPINYMGPGSYHFVSLNKGVLKLGSKNISLKEFMDIEIKEVYFFNSFALKDGKSIVIQGTEKDMSDMIFNNPGLIEEGFKPLSQEEHTKYGFIDVFGHDKNNILTVIECKRFMADPKAVDQLHRYVRKIRQAKGVQKVRGILAAPRISPAAQRMVNDLGFEFKKIEPQKYLERFNKGQKGLDEY